LSALTDDERDLRGGASAAAPQARRARRLTRMRRTATCLLAAMIALLIVCVRYQGAHPWLAWVRAFAEAGAVGAIADWYAVVALFRHPLGLPIPHTSIIPRNQQRIAESLGTFVEENFLEPELIMSRLSGYNAAQALGEWLAERANSQAIADMVGGSLPGLFDDIDHDDVARFFERAVIPPLRTLDVSRAAGHLLTIVAEGERHQPLLDRALVLLEAWLTQNAGLLKAKFSEASRYTPAQLDAYIVNRFVEGIVALLHEVVDNPDHALRHQFDDALRDFAQQLQNSRTYRRFGKLLLRDCIAHFRKGDYAGVLVENFRARVSADVSRERSAVRDTLAGMLVSLGRGVVASPELQHRLNAWWLDVAHALVVRYRHQLSALITEVVKGWNADEVGRKIEAEIGSDLQFIRINGTFVGGMAGVLLHAATLLIAR
jgi:uncharacterized membrane-anchored protein YjiN (DUF445 family)